MSSGRERCRDPEASPSRQGASIAPRREDDAASRRVVDPIASRAFRLYVCLGVLAPQSVRCVE